MTDDPKDIIYIDMDDEITAVIDKLQSSQKKIVALVLPKRAAVFQSVVNMKLLKRTADNADKRAVLITSESALLPLAGAVGMYVARTPQSKPEIPPAPFSAKAAANIPEGDEDVDLDKSAPVGALAGVPDDEEEDIQVDNSEPTAAAAGAAGKAGKKGKKAKDATGKKKLKIPNFDKFRTKLILGIAGGVALIVLLLLAFVVLPKATVTLKTDTSNLDTNLTIVADPNAQALDLEKSVVPAVSKEFRKTDTEKVPATGQKDLGTKAAGNVTLSVACASGTPTIPAGTVLSADNLAFVTNAEVTIASFPDNSGGGCQFHKGVDVTAQSAGAQYNIAAGKTFSVSGYSSVSGSNSAAMTGGTSNIVKVVTQEDVDKAKDAITKRVGTEAPDDLTEDIRKEGYYPIEETINAAEPTVSAAPVVGTEAAEVTVTSTTVFTMLGAKEDDLKKLIEADAKKKIDPSKQIIRDNGLDEATIIVEKKGDAGRMTLSLKTIVIAGPDLNEDEIKKEIVGKERGQVQEILKKRPGINDVEVAYSPFWVQSTPKSTKKIKIIVEGNKTDNAQQP
jgi:hypothetical protein